MKQHSCLIISPRDTDYIKDVNSPIVFRAVSENWQDHIDFFERQKFAWETDACVIFTAQESFDVQMNDQIEDGVIPEWLLAAFYSLGYMDPNNLDGEPRFHSSPRFIHVCAGTKLNGTSLPTPWDTMRKYGVLPWTDLPFNETTSFADYFSPIPQNLLDKAKNFLALIGGKDAIRYHWIVNGGKTNIKKMQDALPQAPLCIGTPVCEPWNQVQPPTCSGQSAAHSTMCYRINDLVSIFDHYNPFLKQFAPDYSIPYVLQGIVAVNPMKPLPANIQPTQQNVSILQKLVLLYQQLVAVIQKLKGLWKRPN